MTPSPRRSIGLQLLLVGCLAVPALSNGQDPTATLTGTWRFTQATTAPWSAPQPDGIELIGKTLNLTANGMQGPDPLNCRRAQLEASRAPAEGLFQGNLPAPADKAARGLGLGVLPVAGLRVTCGQGLFDFHQADAETLLLGLDNQIWTLSRAPGALAEADSPPGQVQHLLETHFAGRMAFEPDSAAAKTRFQSERLNQLVANYLARPRPDDEAPPINGDPYTDSQEYPTRFAVGATRIEQNRARVPVRFADAWSERTITFELVREAGSWRVDDLDYGGARMSDQLEE
jgi:hypothetical protein